MNVRLEQVQIHTMDNLAMVTCIEDMRSDGGAGRYVCNLHYLSELLHRLFNLCADQDAPRHLLSVRLATSVHLPSFLPQKLGS